MQKSEEKTGSETMQQGDEKYERHRNSNSKPVNNRKSQTNETTTVYSSRRYHGVL